MRSVGDAAFKMVMEVRRQFKEIPGLWKVLLNLIINVVLQLVPSCITRNDFTGSYYRSLPGYYSFCLRQEALGGLLSWRNR